MSLNESFDFEKAFEQLRCIDALQADLSQAELKEKHDNLSKAHHHLLHAYALQTFSEVLLHIHNKNPDDEITSRTRQQVELAFVDLKNAPQGDNFPTPADTRPKVNAKAAKMIVRQQIGDSSIK
ncbi:hypothetical protein BLNAU_12517 [Blattamonas nauphoetae]|uniref:Uncharacterized protein n=1 Tax=Blattamonas nauphoetae TaxID=2049346 RepID=A0ABQ9XJE3_9EUKA|nr:hypothetical protein BLNAU_12517 [Blattamonas nauphoetae]